ncbi:MAG: hypothetical protein WC155_02110 [Candidatus Cloacimonadales bacterium]
MNDEKKLHLTFIQDVITRMNNNSFKLKGWCITVLAAVLAVYTSTKNEYFILIAILPTLTFWFLDAYYLLQERKFTGIYNDVAGLSENPKTTKIFQMNPTLYSKADNKKYSYLNVLKSRTILFLYLSIIFFCISLYLYLHL